MSDNNKFTGQHVSATDSRGTTSFGFRTVAEEARQGLVNNVFAEVAERYDLMNDLMSAGVHRLWKNELVSMLVPPRSNRAFHLLDVAGGTGDVALRFLERAGPEARVTLADISPEMLAVGRQRIAKARRAEQVAIMQGNAEALALGDRTFDGYTIAFGIRNVTHIDQALREAYRLLKPGGHFLCLEFSQCQMPILDKLYDLHSFHIIPMLGELAAGSSEPYRYLVESIRRFPNQETFAGLIRNAGFERVSYRNLTGGVAAIHSGWRI